MTVTIISPARSLGSRRETRSVPFHALVCRVAVALALSVGCQSALGQAMFRIKPIGPIRVCDPVVDNMPQVTGFNNAGAVVGAACNANGDAHAFVWRNNGKPMVDLGPAELGSTSRASGINASGLVVGSATDSTGTYGFLSYGNGAPMTKIRNRLGGAWATANAVNDSGQVTGEAENSPPNAGTSDAFLWNSNGSPMIDLPGFGWPSTYGLFINASGQVAGAQNDGDRTTSTVIWENDGSPAIFLEGGGIGMGPCCINASGQVAGNFSVSGYSHPHGFVWRNDGTGMHDLGTLPGGSLSAAHAQNDSGQVAGASWTGYFVKERAVVWMNDGTPIKNLGALGGSNSQSNDINASGQVTGWSNIAGDAAVHAFLWRNNGTKMQDLNNLIDPTDPLKPYVILVEGNFINDSGDILADGIDSRTGMTAPYLLQGTVLTLSPRALAFGNQLLNTASSAKSVTVTNTSAKVVAITSIAMTGTGSSQFASSSNCGSSMVAHATCTIKVTFRPTTKGAKSATLNVNGGGGGLRTVNLTGTGT